MFNDPNFFWKNFRLGTELQVSGSFIYNALLAFDQLEHFYYEEQLFEFLYNTSVGIERLEKIAVILLEHNDNINQEEFEKTLITHNHLDLLKRIRKCKTIELGKTHTKFMQLISGFYQSTRYGRYNLQSVFQPDQSQQKLVTFLEDQLKIKIGAEFLNVTPNDGRIKKFVGKTINKIAMQLYKVIRDEAIKQRMATYEIPYGSKAFKIFIAGEYTFAKERLLQKELLLYLMKTKTNDGFQKYTDELKPLPFGSRNTNYYVHYVLDFQKCPDVMDELEYIHEENKFDKERTKSICLMGGDYQFEKDDLDWE